MASPFIQKNGGRRVDTCCNFNCRQSRDCPVRQACELPSDDFDPSKPNVLASAVKYGLIVACFIGLGLAPLFFR